MVEIDKNASIWFNCVIRVDVGSIRISDETNIQDGTVIHVDRNQDGITIISNMVTVWHFCMLHACTVHNKPWLVLALYRNGTIQLWNLKLYGCC
ncbi:MAG: hypothetical protein ACR5K2_00705 [Wolbachia sp.]